MPAAHPQQETDGDRQETNDGSGEIDVDDTVHEE